MKNKRTPGKPVSTEEVYLDHKSDFKTTLGLSYYSNRGVQIMIMDSFINLFIVKRLTLSNNNTLCVDELVEQTI